jgi:hypothetical protein
VLLGGVTGLEQPLVAFADLLFDERRHPFGFTSADQPS